MDRIYRDELIKALKKQLELCRIQAASLDNDAQRRSELKDARYAIQLLLDFLQRKESNT